MTVWILHYLNRTTREEYIILLDQDSEPTAREIHENQVPGFEPQERGPIRAEFDKAGVLPFGERLKKAR